MAKKRDEFYSPLPGAMGLVLALSAAGCIGMAVLWRAHPSAWALSCAITCGMFAYHMLIRFAAPALLWIVFRRHYNPASAWFAPRPWEEKLYRRLRVHRWKGRALTYAPDEFSLRLHSLDEIVQNMCHAEAVHALIAALSLLSMLFILPFGAPGAFISTAILAALLDTAFIVIQRYNRPRIMRLAQRQRRIQAQQHLAQRASI